MDADGVKIGAERIRAATVLWAAGVEASPVGRIAGLQVDHQGRIMVEPDLSVKNLSNVFVAGDLAHFPHQTGSPLPGTAAVALQQGRFVARTIRNEIRSKPRGTFRFRDKGQMATIGRSKAVLELGKLRLAGSLAWMAWLLVHVYYLSGFHNRLLVVLHWGYSYFSFRRGARLIVNKEWRFGSKPHRQSNEPAAESDLGQEKVSEGRVHLDAPF